MITLMIMMMTKSEWSIQRLIGGETACASTHPKVSLQRPRSMKSRPVSTLSSLRLYVYSYAYRERLFTDMNKYCACRAYCNYVVNNCIHEYNNFIFRCAGV